MGEPRNHSDTREHILRAALRSFAECGYAAASVQRIVDDAKVSKPSLYYYFKDKAALFEALVDRAHEERYEMLRSAAERGETLDRKLEEIATAMFEYALRNGALMRLGFASAFAGPGEMPCPSKCKEKGKRNYDFVRSLLAAAQVSGELKEGFSPDDLAMGFYGQLTTYVVIGLLLPDIPLNRTSAQQIVKLFLDGARGRVKDSRVGRRKVKLAGG
jgi:AcrR family transcriptional regulator